MNMDSEGYYSKCEYCGELYLDDVDSWTSHSCPEKREYERKQKEEAERRRRGGGRVKGRIIIDYECYDSDEAFDSLMTSLSLFGLERIGGTKHCPKMGIETLEHAWQVTHTRGKI